MRESINLSIRLSDEGILLMNSSRENLVLRHSHCQTSSSESPSSGESLLALRTEVFVQATAIFTSRLSFATSKIVSGCSLCLNELSFC